MKNSVLQLKDNVLSFRNDEDLAEQLEVRPEVIYIQSEGDVVQVVTGGDSLSDSSEAKDLVPLEPLVEYMNVYEDGREEVELPSDVNCKLEITEGTTREDVIIESDYVVADCNSQEVSEINPESNAEVEPVMPFFLTSQPMFTILNENNEVGETIILEIENIEEKKSVPPPLPEALEEFQKSLCLNSEDSVTGTYTCDICYSHHGCLNCLKSHYETLHLFSAIRRYKCKFSHHVSKSVVCPVCELTFNSRTETMDHYITHSVGCEICGSGFDRQAYLRVHYKTVHFKGDYQSLYECELCKMTYQYAATLAKHYRTFHKMTLCHVCKERFATVRELQEHERVHQEKLNVLPFACSKCDKAFPRISDIAVHIRQDHYRKESESAVTFSRSQKTKSEESMGVPGKKIKVEK